MNATTWPELGGKELRYGGHTWQLTGDVDVRATGEVLAVEATQVDDVRRRTATLRFGLESGDASLNPGNLGDHFDQLEREGDRYAIVVRKGPRTYRYVLHGRSFR